MFFSSGCPEKSFRNIKKNLYTRQGELHAMKNLAIRTFVVALAVAGFSASSMYSASTARNNNLAKSVVSHPGVVSTPNGTCAPGGGRSCGLD
jgi:hypothetical protein